MATEQLFENPAAKHDEAERNTRFSYYVPPVTEVIRYNADIILTSGDEPDPEPES